MITESRFIEDAIYKQVVDTEGVRAAFDNGTGMTGIYRDYRDVQVLGVSKYFEEMWVIVASKQVSEALAPVTYLRNFIINIGTTGIIFIILIAVFTSTGVTSSIEKTTEATRRIARRDLENPILDYKSMGELRELSDLIHSEINKHREASLYNIHAIKGDDHHLLKLKRSSEEWVTTFDANTDPITIHDKNSRIVRANKAFLEKFNFDKKQIIGKKCSYIFGCSEENKQNCVLTKCSTSLKPECEEAKDQATGGTYLILTYPLLVESGVFQGAIRQYKNITEKKRVGEEIKRSKEFSENLIQTAQDAIVCICEEGIVNTWNLSAERIFGYSRLEIVGLPITTIIPERYRNKHDEGIKRFLQTGQTKKLANQQNSLE